jgi:hypothetical protein
MDSTEAPSPVEVARLKAGETFHSLSIKSGISRGVLARKIAKPELFNLGDIQAIAEALNIKDPVRLMADVMRSI